MKAPAPPLAAATLEPTITAPVAWEPVIVAPAAAPPTRPPASTPPVGTDEPADTVAEDLELLIVPPVPPTRPPAPVEAPAAPFPTVTEPDDEALTTEPAVLPTRAPTLMPSPPVTLTLARVTFSRIEPVPAPPNRPTLPLCVKPFRSTNTVGVISLMNRFEIV